LNLVSFKSGSGSAVALLGGHADLSVNNYGEMMGQVEGKTLKALGVMTEKRHPLLPNVPTFREQGFDVVGINPRGFWAPPDFPPAAIKYWEDAFGKMVKTKAYKEYNDSTAGMETFVTGKELKIYFDDAVAGIAQDLKALGLYEEKK
jgi:putative tricarboxylic transport membrane protein